MRVLIIAILLFTIVASCSPEQAYEPSGDERIALIGNSLPDRMQHDGWLETWMQLAWPEPSLVIRNLGFTGDRVDHRPRHQGFPSADELLEDIGATTLFAFFGYNESFDDDPASFEEGLEAWIEHTREQRYDGEQSPEIVLFSPIAHEDLHDGNLPDGRENNRRLADYTEVMERVAGRNGLRFVDLFEATRELYRSTEIPLTLNGVHLLPEGNRQLARIIVNELAGSLPQVSSRQIENVREAVLDKNWHWFNRYRATSGNDIWGSRGDVQGNRETLIHELEMIDVMTANRDRVIRAAVRGESTEPDDSSVPDPLPVETTLADAEQVEFPGGEDAIRKMEVADGLEVNLFASEERFPELVNPVQLQVDPQGRLWAASWATYPKWEPLQEMNDRLLILEDESGNGRADKATTFARVHNPTGFEFWNGGVLVFSAPNVVFLKDTTGDDRADVRIKFMGAIDSADTHHSANNVVFGPDGNIYYQRGIFLHSNIETPWDRPFESQASGLYRFNPKTHEVEFLVENNLNPHGISFDRWGNLFLTDATTGQAYHAFPEGEAYVKERLLDHTVRPVPGNHLLSSLHLPEEFENNFLIFNVMGFRGAKRYELSYENGAVRGREIGDLFRSDGLNFRPTDGAVGSDGAFYVSDWHNPVIGHLQHNLRDPMRDHQHGRIYRISAPERDLQQSVGIYDEPVSKLLETFRHPVDGIRHRVRVELSSRESGDILEATRTWGESLDPQNPDDWQPLLEGLWLHQQHRQVNRDWLERVREIPDERYRQAADRVAWEWERTRRTRASRDARMARSESPQVVFVTGDEEYRSEESMPMLARILGDRYGFDVSVAYAVTDSVIDPNRSDNIEGLEALENADLMVMYTRFRDLPDEQLRYITDFVQSGRPVVGFRTATHAFRYGEDHPDHYMDNEWPQEVLGLPWISHHGGENSTDVTITEGAEEHPVLRGVEPFHARSWLYHADTLHERARPLLTGRAVSGPDPEGDYFDDPHPVAWTHRHMEGDGDARVFFTTLGHPQDFFKESMRRLSIQGIFWALGLEEKIPSSGLDVRFVGEYDPNPAGFGEEFKQGVEPEEIPLSWR